MNMTEQFWKMPVFAPNDGTGAGDPPPEGGNETPPPGGSDASSPGGSETPPPGDGGAAPADAWWKSDKLTEDQRSSLTAAGLTVDDPTEAVAKLVDMEIAAQRRLGAKPDQLLHKPKEGQSVSDWMQENREVFGIPESADGYEITMPEGFGDGADDLKWDTDFESAAREIALAEGVSGPALQKMTDLYASKMKSLMGDADAQYAQANEKMMTELNAAWGTQAEAKMTMAKQAAQSFGAKAGLSSEQISGMGALLAAKTGDAGAVKIFAAIGEAMSEDSLKTLPGNGGELTTTPAEARAELQKLQSADGEYYKAVAEGDKTKLDQLKPLIDQLTKIAAGT